jgi:selenocysteine lyase/cysteine desulfurase
VNNGALLHGINGFRLLPTGFPTHYIRMDDAAFREWTKAQFPSLETMLYLNHAAISPWPRAASEAARDFAAELAEQGPLQGAQWLRRESELRQVLARLLNADSADDIALLKNTTEGICTVANGIEWQAGDNLVTPDDEFLSNQLAWDALAERGVQLRKVAARHSEDPEGELLAAMDHRTRVLTISAVSWVDGFRYDLRRLGEVCRASPALLFVDAIQQFGALATDVQACGIDALAAGSHKWQLGPEGMAVFYCSPQWREQLRLSQRGWRMLDHPYRFDPPDREPSASARRFEAGTPNSLGQAILLASLQLLEQLDPQRAEQRILDNTRLIIEALEAIPGVAIRSDTSPARRSGIVSFCPPGGDVSGLRQSLSRAGIYGAVRGDMLRLSPHYYQGEAQLQALFVALDELMR